MGVGIVGPQGNRLAIGGDGLIEQSSGLQRNAEIEVSFGVAGSQDDCLAVGGDGLIHPPAFPQGIAEIVARVSVAGVEGDRPTDQFQGHVPTPGLTGNQPQLVRRTGISRTLAQDLPVQPLGLRQAPGLMMLPRQLEHMLERVLRHVSQWKFRSIVHSPFFILRSSFPTLRG